MKTRKEKIEAIYEKIETNDDKLMIGDILEYIDKNLFRTESKEYKGMRECDVKAREKCVITLYNHYIGRQLNSPIEKLDDTGINFIFNLL